MKTSISIKADIDKTKFNSKGECQIYIYVNATINSQRIRKKLYTVFNISPNYWEASKEQIKNTICAYLANHEIETINGGKPGVH